MKLFVFCLFLLLPTVSSAVDGVLEINQTCAVQTGCFSGDTAGFPVTLGGSGGTSYRLTSDLDTSPDADATALIVIADHVTLDLNGFSIIGPTICTGNGLGATVSCSPGRGEGIAASNLGLNAEAGLMVRDGTVRGFAGGGIRAGERAQIRHVAAESNGDTGIEVGSRSIVSGSIANMNEGIGISAGEGSVAERNVSSSNLTQGIVCQAGSSLIGNIAYRNGSAGVSTTAATVTGNTAYQNGGDGISAAIGSVSRGNTAYLNGGDGIRAFGGNTIIDNTSWDNGDTTDSTLDDGIQCGVGCTVRGNTVRQNSGFGLNLGTDSAYRENVVSNNTEGQVTGGGVDAGANLINGVVTPTP